MRASVAAGQSPREQQDETSGSVEALDSMLLQHEGGVLRLFPDWPTKMDASFTRLRAKGAFLISSEQRAGAVRYVDVTSEKGGTLVIASPWKNNEVHVNADKAGGSLLQPDGTGRIKLTTQPGVSYHLNIQ